MPQHCATMQNSALDAAPGALTDRRHKQSSLLESEPTPPPGKRLRCHDRHLIGYVRAPRRLEDPRRELSSIISRPVSRETGDPE